MSCIYNCNCKTLMFNRAGKHHRGLYPGSCPCKCSLLFFKHTGHAQYLINQSMHQPWWIFFLHFKFLQSLNSRAGHSIFFVDHTRSNIPCCQLFVGQCLWFYQHFCQLCCQMLAHFTSLDLASFTVVVSFTFIHYENKWQRASTR